MSFVDDFVAQILSLQVSLYHSLARLQTEADSEALHDLRIAVRKLRSLLRPLRKRPEVALLNRAASEVGRQTTPTRELEVLIEELQKMGYQEQANRRLAVLPERLMDVANSSELTALLLTLDQWPEMFRKAERAGELDNVKGEIEKSIIKQVRSLIKALGEKDHDRHDLRILVKNTRYLSDAFPNLSPLKYKSKVNLKVVQAALGSWHDHFQWCSRTEHEVDLLILSPWWTTSAENALANAEEHLGALFKSLKKDLASAKGTPDD